MYFWKFLWPTTIDFVSVKKSLTVLWWYSFFGGLTRKNRNRNVPIVRLIKSIKKPIPKFLGNGMLLDNKNLNKNPPTKLPTLLRANPNPKNFPRSDFKVD